MRQAPGESVQKLCPSCSTLAFTGDRRCPWCGSSYKRRIWAPLLALMLVQTALLLGGVAYMLVVFGDEVDKTLDEQVADVQRDLDESFDDVRRVVRDELDRRLPEPAP
jgi:RNA polymerase subunit RPABC4/transcription elongation factor Spt4